MFAEIRTKYLQKSLTLPFVVHTVGEWQFPVPKKYYALLNDAFTFGNAKAAIYGE
jgi:hypothetical protein